MTEWTAYCGLACDQCPALLATKADDDERRARVARQWSRLFGADIAPQDINCDGCRSRNGRLFSHCHVCEIRACATRRDLVNCGHCPDYPCEKLEFIFQAEPKAKQRLDAVRDGISNERNVDEIQLL
jgi:hypothetical protein